MNRDYVCDREPLYGKKNMTTNDELVSPNPSPYRKPAKDRKCISNIPNDMTATLSKLRSRHATACLLTLAWLWGRFANKNRGALCRLLTQSSHTIPHTKRDQISNGRSKEENMDILAATVRGFFKLILRPTITDRCLTRPMMTISDCIE